MKKSIQSLFLAFVMLTFLLSGCAAAPVPPTFTPEPTSTATQSQITINEAPGNLESAQSIGCEPVSNLKNTYTPPDLYNGMVECINHGTYSVAVYLFALAGTYSYYDMLRVADNTAHDAHSVLLQQILDSLDKTQKDALQQELRKTLGNDGNLPKICKEISRIGAPQYYPRYMIQHGMDAFNSDNSGDGLVKNFDPDAAWKKAMDGYLHCSNSTPSPMPPTLTPDPNATPISMVKKDVPITVGGVKLLIVLATNDAEKIKGLFFDATHSAEETTLYVEAQIVSGKFDPFAKGISLTDENGKECPRTSAGWTDISEDEPKKPHWNFIVPKASKSFTLHFPDGQMFKLDLILEMVP